MNGRRPAPVRTGPAANGSLIFIRRFRRATPNRVAVTSVVAALLVASALSVAVAGATPSPDTAPSLALVLSRYRQAIAEPGSVAPTRIEASGLVGGEGLVGRFHRWRDGSRSREDESLGPRTEQRFSTNGAVEIVDENGDDRRLTGPGLLADRTMRAVDDGRFAGDARHCTMLGTTDLGDRRVDLVSYAPDGGAPETIGFDELSGLPARIAFDENDGTTTLELSDWHRIAGRSFPMRVVRSNGDRDFDVVYQTDRVDVDGAIDPDVFTVPAARAPEPASAQTVPIEVIDGHLYVPVRLLGRPYRFLIDTGSRDVVIDATVANRLGIESEGFLEASGANRTAGVGLAKIADLQVGRSHLRDLVVATLDLRGTTTGALPVDGILGFPFFAESLVTIDEAARTMTFGAPGSFTPAGERLAVDVDRAVPEARLRLDGSIDAPFVVDTGNTSDLLLYRPFVLRTPGIVPEGSAGPGSFGIGGAAPAYRTVVDRLDLGTFSLFHVDTDVMLVTKGAFADRFDAGNVGLGTLAGFVTTFDEPEGAIYLARGPLSVDGAAHRP